VGLGRERQLPLAVIAEARGLEDASPVVLAERARQFVLVAYDPVARGRGADPREEGLFLRPILAGGEHLGPRAHRLRAGQFSDRAERQVLELDGHHVDRARETGERVRVLVRRDGGEIGHLGGRPVGLGREHVAAIAEARRGERGHASELAAAEDADHGAGREPHPASSGGSLGVSGTAAVCAARQASSARATAGSCSARIEAASRAALIAPARPIASVPTGTPPGICTIDSRLSRPCSARLSTGTPSTGSVVIEATMPGRWAAPPAPAMITWRPRARAVVAYSKRRLGVRCAETIRTSWAIASSSSTAAAWRSVDQSDWLPMIRPTRGACSMSSSVGRLGGSFGEADADHLGQRAGGPGGGPVRQLDRLDHLLA